MFKLWIGVVFVGIFSGQIVGGNVGCPLGLPNTYMCFQFGGAGIPNGWTSVGSVHSESGRLNIANGQLSSDAHFEAFCENLIFRANIRGAKNQHLGLAANLQTGPWILFSTDDSTGHLYARIRADDGTDVKLPLNAIADPHHQTNGYLGGGTTFQIRQGEVRADDGRGPIVPLIMFSVKVDGSGIGGAGFLEVVQRQHFNIQTPMRIVFYDGGFATADGQRGGIDLSSVDYDCVARQSRQPPHSPDPKGKR